VDEHREKGAYEKDGIDNRWGLYGGGSSSRFESDMEEPFGWRAMTGFAELPKFCVE
jgi:hypothetical protein